MFFNSSTAWGDYDNDGDLDILLTGFDGINGVSSVYRNDGTAATIPPGSSVDLGSSASNTKVKAALFILFVS